MRWIKDSVYGDIYITQIASELIDTTEMQRLRRITQTSFCNLIYPGANHTRFEHSLGAYYLTNRWLFFQNVSKERGEVISAAALLHDIGHTCFSHALEDVLKRHSGYGHEHFTEEKIMKSEIREIIEHYGINPEEIVGVLRSLEGEIIHGDIGTDRMDYLLRDSKYTGVAYGAVDYDRILRKMHYYNDKLVLEEKALSAAESMLLARFMMFPSVYAHPVPKSAEFMLERAVEKAIEDHLISVEQLVEWDDVALVQRLRESWGVPKQMIDRILDRRLFKRVAERPLKDFENWLFLGGLSYEKTKALERELAETVGLEPYDIILYIPKAWFGNISINILRDNDIYNISEVSLISRVLKEAQWDYCKVSVLCPEEKKEQVEEHVDAFFKEIEGITGD
ncbi:MAG: HD domain-containing protein [Candidatus Diapherotrites archaeon]|nr:HD domain-containing protein [Candidatus Diapherotrites archaeon]